MRNNSKKLLIGGANHSGTFIGNITDDAPQDATSEHDALNLFKVGTGTETLSGNNTYSGGTNVNAGTLQMGSSTALGNTTVATRVVNGRNAGSERPVPGRQSARSERQWCWRRCLINSSSTAASLAGNITSTSGSYTIGGVGDITLTGAVQGSATKTDGNSLTLGGTTDNVGLGLAVNGGTVILAKSSSSSPPVHAVGAGGIVVMNGGIVRLGGSGGDQIDDSASVTVEDGGEFDMNGQSETFARLTLQSASQLDPALLLNDNGATATLNAPITLTGAGSTFDPDYGDLILTGVVSGTGSLNMRGASILALDAANTYGGGTNVYSGIVQLGNPGRWAAFSC